MVRPVVWNGVKPISWTSFFFFIIINIRYIVSTIGRG